MNGKETQYFNTKFIELKTQVEERWSAYEKVGRERRIELKEDLLEIKQDIKTALNRISKFPCAVHTERMKSIKLNIYGLWTLLITVLGWLAYGAYK